MALSRLWELLKLAHLGRLNKQSLTRHALLATALSPEATQQIHRYFAWKAVSGLINPFTHDGQLESCQYSLGFQGNNSKSVSITDSDLNRHIIVAGVTGSGKTNWLNFFAAQLLQSGKNVIWLDLKNEARHLLRQFPDIWVFRIEDFRWNPLAPPPGIPTKHWLNAFVSAYAHAFGILHASEGAIYQYVDDLYRKFGVYDGSGKFPCLLDLRDYLDQVKARPWSDEARYLSRTMNRIETLCRVLDNTIAVSKGFDLKGLLNRSWVLELGSLKPDVQSFVAESLLMAMFTYRMANGLRSDGLKNVVIFDEGKRIWDRNKEQRAAEGIPTITNIISQVREFGIAVIVADQDPQMLSQSLLDNAGTKICMALGSGRSINEMATAMGLSPKQKEFIYRFKAGHACVKVTGHDPFLIVIPEFPIEKTVTDTEVVERSRRMMSALGVEPRIPLEPDQTAANKLPGDLRRFLDHVALNPLLSVTERFTALSLSAWKGSRTIRDLQRLGLVTAVEIHRGGRGGKAKYLQLTTKGREALKSEGIEFKQQGRGSIRHLYWQHKIAERYRQRGYYVEVESQQGGLAIDVLAVDPDGRRTGVQVVTCDLDSHELVGIGKAGQAGFENVIVACETAELCQAIQTRIGSDTSQPVGQVTVVRAEELIGR